MKTYVALLRGLNVGGNHKVSMSDLKVLFSLTYENVETHGNTGVVFFDSKNKVDRVKLETDLEKTFGFPIAVYILSAEEVFALEPNLPIGWNEDKEWRHNILFLLNDVRAEQICPDLSLYDTELDHISIIDNTIFWSTNFTTRQLYYKSAYRKVLAHPNYPDTTIRNGNTFAKMIQILKKREGESRLKGDK
ncbi:DUF1697 domain-containing protein [Erysipelothrix inopinata]|uniref:DUF1697 domain-containing protein n=1 Tax=Erysipelothrix inopinata TaxID=225084 RepID=A0A7G9RZ47_9FIRM|nr:DUF1697 domain-containing protein [Erysipelothrix inopinata]QNN60872.1 DUF1697 domain-containing protein [Erysipelothrix inopinata]